MAVEDEVQGRQEPQGLGSSISKFFSEGNSRWPVLFVVLFGVVGVVAISSPEADSTLAGLRQQLLLKNGDRRADSHTSQIRRSLAGSGPVLKEWDQLKHLKNYGGEVVTNLKNVPGSKDGAHMLSTEDGWSQILQAASDMISGKSQPKEAAAADANPTSFSCKQSCEAKGYSSDLSSSHAARACYDMCMDGKGFQNLEIDDSMHPHLSASSVQFGDLDKLSNAQKVLAEVKSSVPHARSNMFDRKVSSTTLSSALSSLNVDPSSLPANDANALNEAIAMDNRITQQQRQDRQNMKKVWGTSMKQMRTLEAAKLQNSAELLDTVEKAEKQTNAKIALDSSLLAAASKFEKDVGGNNLGKDVPVDVQKVAQELQRAEKSVGPIRAAVKSATSLYSEERQKWKAGDDLVKKQLLSHSFVDPGSDIESSQWNKNLNAAAVMPKAESDAVRMSAMSDGRLEDMEKKVYSTERKNLKNLKQNLHQMKTARIANAGLVGQQMAKAATRSIAEANLLAAERKYVSTMNKIGTRQSAVGQDASSLQLQIQKKRAQANALEKSSEAASAILGRYGMSLKDISASHASLQSGSRRSAGVASAAKPAVAQSSGKAAVQGASQGWFKLW
mmetsp:Transcript_34338/g.77348  ORF Transcript_34338/g.77348 Transcript_34338/m.77348 type:complete len:616 (-) Transcript_34338:84-1931(-)